MAAEDVKALNIFYAQNDGLYEWLQLLRVLHRKIAFCKGCSFFTDFYIVSLELCFLFLDINTYNNKLFP